jgi:hypothetical protein
MKAMLIYLLVACSATLGSPRFARAQGPVPASSPAAQASVAALSPEEAAQLAQLSAQDPSLTKQSAGDRVIIVERGPRRDGWGYRRGPTLGAVVLTVVLVALLVVALQPGDYRR